MNTTAKVSGHPAVEPAARIVLGLGGALDYELTWDTAILDRLVRQHRITEPEVSDPGAIASERDLLRSLLSYLARGYGDERFVASSKVIEQFAGHFHRRVTLGGTSVRAALALHALGMPSTLHLVNVDDQVRSLLPPGVRYICSAGADRTEPHLIVQFRGGDAIRVGPAVIRAPRPNRIIYVNDPANRRLELSDRLGDVLSTADVFLISGFNVFQDEGDLRKRLSELRTHLNRLHRDAIVLYEDAGFHVPAFAPVVQEIIGDRIDVHSLNEDELQRYVGTSVDLLDVDAVAAAVRTLRTKIVATTLVVHTATWAAAVGPQAADRFDGPLRCGIAVAGARYLHGDAITADRVRNLARAYPPVPVAADFAGRWNHQASGGPAEEVHCVPARELTTPTPTTIGLGDAFVGGMLAALARPSDRDNRPARSDGDPSSGPGDAQTAGI